MNGLAPAWYRIISRVCDDILSAAEKKIESSVTSEIDIFGTAVGNIVSAELSLGAGTATDVFIVNPGMQYDCESLRFQLMRHILGKFATNKFTILAAIGFNSICVDLAICIMLLMRFAKKPLNIAINWDNISYDREYFETNFMPFAVSILIYSGTHFFWPPLSVRRAISLSEFADTYPKMAALLSNFAATVGISSDAVSGAIFSALADDGFESIFEKIFGISSLTELVTIAVDPVNPFSVWVLIPYERRVMPSFDGDSMMCKLLRKLPALLAGFGLTPNDVPMGELRHSLFTIFSWMIIGIICSTGASSIQIPLAAFDPIDAVFLRRGFCPAFIGCDIFPKSHAIDVPQLELGVLA
ncbi:MAG: hypothetical protein LBB38_03870 [Puniceicoccales bacterium]|jgi:hypothetical protein|nr:hypothetical protein [Puniceicoccales bacterium]